MQTDWLPLMERKVADTDEFFPTLGRKTAESRSPPNAGNLRGSKNKLDSRLHENDMCLLPRKLSSFYHLNCKEPSVQSQLNLQKFAYWAEMAHKKLSC